MFLEHIGFPIKKKKCMGFQREKKWSFESVIEIFQTIDILKTSIVPYISLSEKHWSKVIIFHLFWVSVFVQV